MAGIAFGKLEPLRCIYAYVPWTAPVTVKGFRPNISVLAKGVVRSFDRSKKK